MCLSCCRYSKAILFHLGLCVYYRSDLKAMEVMSLSTSFSMLWIRTYVIAAQSKTEQISWTKSNKWVIKLSQIVKRQTYNSTNKYAIHLCCQWRYFGLIFSHTKAHMILQTFYFKDIAHRSPTEELNVCKG